MVISKNQLNTTLHLNPKIKSLRIKLKEYNLNRQDLIIIGENDGKIKSISVYGNQLEIESQGKDDYDLLIIDLDDISCIEFKFEKEGE